MGTYLTGRKIDTMEKNDRAVFTVFEDRHGHPEMIKKNVPCRSVMMEGRIGTIHKKEFTNRKGATKCYRLLRFEIEEMGSWQCSRDVCTLVVGLDPKKTLMECVEEAKQAGTPTYIGMPVRKSGRTTEYTEGEIIRQKYPHEWIMVRAG